MKKTLRNPCREGRFCHHRRKTLALFVELFGAAMARQHLFVDVAPVIIVVFDLKCVHYAAEYDLCIFHVFHPFLPFAVVYVNIILP